LSVQRRHPEFKSYKQDTTISIDKLKANLISQGVTSESHFREQVLGRMYEILRLVFLGVKDKLDAKFGCF